MIVSPSSRPLHIFAFADSRSAAHSFVDAGVDAVIGRRPSTQQDAEDLSMAEWAELLDVPLFVQIRRFHAGTGLEVERAIECGASGIALPGAHSAGEVETLIRLVRGRADTLIHVDTFRLLKEGDTLRQLDWDYLHVGLRHSTNTADATSQRAMIAEFIASLGGRSVGCAMLPFRSEGRLLRADLNQLQEMHRIHSPLAIIDAPNALPSDVARAWIRSIRRAWGYEHRIATLPSPAEWDRSWASPP